MGSHGPSRMVLAKRQHRLWIADGPQGSAGNIDITRVLCSDPEPGPVTSTEWRPGERERTRHCRQVLHLPGASPGDRGLRQDAQDRVWGQQRGVPRETQGRYEIQSRSPQLLHNGWCCRDFARSIFCFDGIEQDGARRQPIWNPWASKSSLNQKTGFRRIWGAL